LSHSRRLKILVVQSTMTASFLDAQRLKHVLIKLFETHAEVALHVVLDIFGSVDVVVAVEAHAISGVS
jgi:hypothetical protein